MNDRTEKPEEVAFYMQLLLQIYQDMAETLHLKPSSSKRDMVTIEERVKHRGLAFLTKDLPSLGKSLDKALSSDYPFVAPDGFKLSRRAPYNPVFLGELWKRIFDVDGQVQVSDSGGPSVTTIEAVRAIRQISYLFYKLEGCHSIQSEEDTVRKFISTDHSLPEPEGEVPLSGRARRALENAHLLVCFVLGGLDLRDITPGHGPGAVSTGESASEKMFFKRIYESLEEEYPFTDYFFLNYTHLVEKLESLEQLESVATGTAKVVLVPKDSRGPRLISMEPLELQWIQQGQMRALVRQIEQKSNLTRGFVNFTSQEVNRDHALRSSITQEYVTLDMEEASDRVSLWLFRQLFPLGLRKSLEASRSSHTELPNGARIRLKKFAPMGSSCCFPVEALIFWALAVGTLRNVLRSKDLISLPPVYVYGDDLVMRKQDYEIVRPVFEELFLRFNDQKCCTGRFFRESCGMDAFFGISVTPQRIRTRWSDRLSPAATISYVSYSNSLWRDGYQRAAMFIAGANTKAFGRLPVARNAKYHSLAFSRPGLDESKVLDHLHRNFKVRYNSALQRDEVKILTPYSPTTVVGSPDWEELFRSMLRMGPHDPFGVKSVAIPPCCYTVPHQIKVRWSWVDINSLLST